jgi:hypothetical protein
MSAGIRQELNIFNLGENVNEYHQNYLEHILIISNNRIPWKLSENHPKGRRARGQHQRVGWISSSNTKIGTGQKA